MANGRHWANGRHGANGGCPMGLFFWRISYPHPLHSSRAPPRDYSSTQRGQQGEVSSNEEATGTMVSLLCRSEAEILELQEEIHSHSDEGNLARNPKHFPAQREREERGEFLQRRGSKARGFSVVE